MPGFAERIDGLPPPSIDVEAIYLFGLDLNPTQNPSEKKRYQKILAFAFCFQGHCYRLAIPAEYHFDGNDGQPPRGCGFPEDQEYRMWKVEKTTAVTRIEKRGGSAEELILEYNLPGVAPATMTYSAKVVIGSNAGKIYE